jgi:hypothetical protein
MADILLHATLEADSVCMWQQKNNFPSFCSLVHSFIHHTRPHTNPSAVMNSSSFLFGSCCSYSTSWKPASTDWSGACCCAGFVLFLCPPTCVAVLFTLCPSSLPITRAHLLPTPPHDHLFGVLSRTTAPCHTIPLHFVFCCDRPWFNIIHTPITPQPLPQPLSPLLHLQVTIREGLSFSLPPLSPPQPPNPLSPTPHPCVCITDCTASVVRDKTVSVSLTTRPSRLNFGKSQTPIGRSTLVQTPLLMPTVANSLGASTFANSLGVSTL